MKRKRILKQLHDIKPTKSDGSLDMEKISDSERILKISFKPLQKRKIAYKKFNDVRSPEEALFPSSPKKKQKEQNGNLSEARRPNTIQLGQVVPEDLISISKIPSHHIFFNKEGKEERVDSFDFFQEASGREVKNIGRTEVQKSTDDILEALGLERDSRKKAAIKTQAFQLVREGRFASSLAFALAIFIFALILPCFSYIQKGFSAKQTLLSSGKSALGEFAKARENLTSGQFDKASLNFEQSREIFESANEEVSEIGGEFSEVLRFIPGISQVATANYLLRSGEDISRAGKSMSEAMKVLAETENPIREEGKISLTDLFSNLRSGVEEISKNLRSADENISKVNISDLPVEIQSKFVELKQKLSLIASSLRSFSDDSSIVMDLLGYNGPRKFLFLFQNNQEMRATGGFIGSYGILDISNGRIKKLFVDDIYNPDGQLTARVIPPEPIQKMSAVWTMHDANWFHDFPTSAEKVSWFYEKTGGPTVDGVVAMTPTVIEKMLSITGPIEMPEYDTTVDTENFIEETQKEVELEYDKNENRPKKFIADLMPKVLDSLFNTKDPQKILETLEILNSALKEKQILIYSKNFNVQKLVSKQGWSGEILDANRDYLNVVNTNINGYKTDGMIEEAIEHRVNIEESGNITDEVTITRHHNGGNEKYDWWNKVNGDWLRVFVPEGSKLLEASGQTREFISPPLDYQSLQFKKDPQLLQEEQGMKIDEESGTRIYTENRKTVFANWVYASPGETVTLRYKYQLPFRLSFDVLHHPANTFSVLYQKQSGSIGSKLVSEINLPQNMRSIWYWPDNIDMNGKSFIINTSLKTDKFVGIAMEMKN